MVDAMYYHDARENYSRAVSCTEAIERAERRVRYLQRKWRDAERRYPDDFGKRYDLQETIAIQLEAADDEVGVAYAPYLQALAATHVMCAAALESHINLQAKTHLTGKFLDHFERMTLEGKWLFLPRILNKAGFDPGAQPSQGFSRLVTIRNELIHYKGRDEQWDSAGIGVPEFLVKLGLTEAAASDSLKVVKGMVRTLANNMGQPVPSWLGSSVRNYFDVQFSRNDR